MRVREIEGEEEGTGGERKGERERMREWVEKGLVWISHVP